MLIGVQTTDPESKLLLLGVKTTASQSSFLGQKMLPEAARNFLTTSTANTDT